MNPCAQPHLLEAGKDDRQAPRRPLGQARLQLEPSKQPSKKGTGPAKTWEDDLNIYLQTESDFVSSRLKQPARPTTPITTTTTTQPTTHDQTGTTKTHDQNEDDTKDDDEQDDDTLLIISRLIDSRTSTTPMQPHQTHSFNQQQSGFLVTHLH